MLEMTVTYLRAMQRKDTRTEGKFLHQCNRLRRVNHGFIKVNALLKLKKKQGNALFNDL